ncbi:MAG: hypothetical protein NTY09_01710 [bacterium]|nr:hypothetical protein [bacterium]
MKLHICLAALILGLLAVLTLTGCPASRSSEPGQENTSEGLPSEESPAPPDSEVQAASDPVSEDRTAAVTEVAMGFLEKLGYDASTLEVTSLELLPIEYLRVWGVKIGNDLGNVAEFHVNEDTLRLEELGFIYSREGIIAPENVSPDDDLPGLIAEAIGLGDKGYRLTKENGGQNEYRKYADWDEYQIAVSYFVIFVPPDETATILLDFREGELHPPVVINIDRDAAISRAISYLGDSATGTEPSSVDLIQWGTWLSNGTDFPVYWEFAFGQQVVHVNASNGAIMEAS